MLHNSQVLKANPDQLTTKKFYLDLPSGLLEGKISEICILDVHRYVTLKNPEINHKSRMMLCPRHDQTNPISGDYPLSINEFVITFRPLNLSRDDFIFVISEFQKIQMLKAFILHVDVSEWYNDTTTDSKEPVMIIDKDDYKINVISMDDFVTEIIDDFDEIISDISTPDTSLYGLSAKDFYYDIVCDINVWNIDHIIIGG